jgi:hypothetical protein
VELEKKGTYVYIITVSESIIKPHQFDSIYYMRLDGQTIRAPHHYIEALMKQVRYPNLEGSVNIIELQTIAENVIEKYRSIPTGKNIYTLKFILFILNMSGHINEEDVTYIVKTGIGRIVGVNPRAHAKRYSRNETIYRSGVPHPVFSYGDIIQERISIVVHEDDLRLNENKFSFVLIFGGKKSPLKRCDYVFDAARWGVHESPNIFLKAIENKLFIDHVTDKGISKIDIIESALKN